MEIINQKIIFKCKNRITTTSIAILYIVNNPEANFVIRVITN